MTSRYGFFYIDKRQLCGCAALVLLGIFADMSARDNNFTWTKYSLFFTLLSAVATHTFTERIMDEHRALSLRQNREPIPLPG